MIAAGRRLLALSLTDRWLVVEAAVLLVLVRVGVSILPFRNVRRLLQRHAERRGGQSRAVQEASPERIAWAVAATSARLPLPSTCLVQALVAESMLRRRGRSAEIRFGVRRGERGSAVAPHAHAWVECDGRIVVGELERANEYAVLTRTGH